MRIIEPGYEILTGIDGDAILKRIEQIGRVCYKSEDKITQDSAEKFVKGILLRGHESVIEHENITVKFICGRGISHELVRHRIASFSQESTRYCCYANDKFGNELTFIKPLFWKDEHSKFSLWLDVMNFIETRYMMLIEFGAKPEEARSILPNSLKTEIIITSNLREWRHILKLRTSPKAHPQMHQLMIPLLKELQIRIPIIFEDV